MSEENVEIVRRVYELYNAREFDDLLTLLAADFVFVMLPTVPGASTYEGPEGFMQFVSDTEQPFGTLRYEIEASRAVDNNVVVATTATGRGVRSEVNTELRFASVWTLCDGRATRHEGFLAYEEALEAAGLSE